jgi:hypothetical protein
MENRHKVENTLQRVLVEQSQVVVLNLLIIDDPHKEQDIKSR